MEETRAEEMKEMPANQPEQVEELIDVNALTAQLVEDDDLSDEDVDVILEAARKRQAQKVLTKAEIKEILKTSKGGTHAMKFSRVPWPVRIFAVGFILVGVLAAITAQAVFFSFALAFFIEPEMVMAELGVKSHTVSTIVVAVIGVVCFTVQAVLNFITGVHLLRGRRAKAGALLRVIIAVTAVGFACDIMLEGTQAPLFDNLITIAFLAGFSIYLNPAMERGERLRRGLRDLDLEAHAENGTLGLADKGHGFIRLDFFNIFWTFVVCCFLGLVVELIFHMVVVDPGVYQDRAGVLFGPFSPIYGFGAVLMTVFLNRMKDKNILLIFALCTVIGGAFEYFTSWFMEIGFGAVAWDYHDQWLGWLFDGRTCPLYAAMFGVLGVVWIKLLLPGLLKLINMIPWNRRVIITTICAVLMSVNCLMTVQALDCWYSRVAGKPPVSNIDKFYAENFNDAFMQERFQTITINPEHAARS